MKSIREATGTNKSNELHVISMSAHVKRGILSEDLVPLKKIVGRFYFSNGIYLFI